MPSGHCERIDSAAPDDFDEDFNLDTINNLPDDGIASDLAFDTEGEEERSGLVIPDNRSPAPSVAICHGDLRYSMSLRCRSRLLYFISLLF